MSTRSKLAATLASAGVVALGWQVSTVHGQTVAATPSTTNTTSTTTTTTSTTTNSATSGSQTSQSSSDATSQATSSATQTAAANGWQDGTYTGQTISHHYGSVTVTVTIAGGKITSLSEQVVSDGQGHSDRINAEAVPMIRDEILQADSAQVSTIGGATYTTSAYLDSLQSALDQASS